MSSNVQPFHVERAVREIQTYLTMLLVDPHKVEQILEEMRGELKHTESFTDVQVINWAINLIAWKMVRHLWIDTLDDTADQADISPVEHDQNAKFIVRAVNANDDMLLALKVSRDVLRHLGFNEQGFLLTLILKAIRRGEENNAPAQSLAGRTSHA